jgi:DNA-binding transcriptional ArsR family regulator
MADAGADADTGVAGLTAAACLFHGFSDPTRLAILRHLALGEHRVVDLMAHMGRPQSTISKALGCLRDCGLVTSRAHGRASVYSLSHPELLRSLFATADQLLEATGEAVVLCENYGVTTLHETEETA